MTIQDKISDILQQVIAGVKEANEENDVAVVALQENGIVLKVDTYGTVEAEIHLSARPKGAQEKE